MNKYVIIIETECGMYETTFKAKEENRKQEYKKELIRYIKELIEDGEIEKGEYVNYRCELI